jgi:hypothetical protein
LSIEILLDWILDLFTAVFGGIPGCIWSVRQRFIEGTASSNQVTSLQKKKVIKLPPIFMQTLPGIFIRSLHILSATCLVA